ncbi:hypothetical protein REPUB_Repub11eG0014800 [Reevesia pubescens]
MKMLFLKLFTLKLIILTQIHGQKACLEEERIGLLELKSFIKLEGYDSDQVFRSWVDDEPESDCCVWERVSCNSITGRVIQLSLDNLRQQDPFPCTDGSRSGDGWHLLVSNPEPMSWNITLFKPFKDLQILNLSYNAINGWDESQGSKDFLGLERLETLDLSCNNFRNRTLKFSMKLTSLDNLILRNNLLEGPFPAKELSVFENLEALDLSQNTLSDPPTNLDVESLSKLRKLSYLTLHDNQFQTDSIMFLGSLPSLRYLDLSLNRMEGSLLNNGSKDFLRLEQLETLDLSDNSFTNHTLKSLGKLTSIKNLILRSNLLEGSFPATELSVFESLEALDLSQNKLSDSPTKHDIESLSKLRKLRYLTLYENYFKKDIMRFMGSLPSLRYLDLSNNGMEGSLSSHGLCELKRLEELDFRFNSFEGTLPPCLYNLTSLRILDLHDNLFSGSISPYSVPSPKFLQYIDLGGNNFEGSFSLSSIFNHSKLEVVILGSIGNRLQIIVDDENQAQNPLFQLKVLLLSNCNMKNAPNFLLNQHRLREVDLSHNKLNGTFPSWLLGNNIDLKFLNLPNNSFTGRFDLPKHPMNSMVYADVSDNHIGGNLPRDFGVILKNVTHFNLSKNSFEGELPPSISGMTMLKKLDLSFNNFSGEFPIANSFLTDLILSNNNFRGEIFSTYLNWSNVRLRELKLENNQFTGSLITKKEFYSALQVFDISNNSLAGKLPIGIAHVNVLFMRNNHFEGQFPCEDAFRAVFIDLSHNFLSGQLPSCFDMDNIQQIHLQGNKFTGSVPNAILNSSTLSVLNLRDNSLSGKIPALIGAVPGLRILLLGNNRFSGLIPRELCQLIEISIMDLSNNSFSGSIPSCFSNITFGTTNNLYFSFNAPAMDDYEYDLQQADKEDENLLRSHTSTPLKVKRMLSANPSEVVIDFVTKSSLLSYKGDVLSYMSGLDLSCNNLTGEIPENLGKLSYVHALNLSRNHLTGSIPVSFSNLINVESLDLSYNKLSGKIPSEFVNLNFLEVFIVAHNNLSGRIPDKGQFPTFNDSSYEGNPFLSIPSEKNRTKVVDPTPFVIKVKKNGMKSIVHFSLEVSLQRTFASC